MAMDRTEGEKARGADRVIAWLLSLGTLLVFLLTLNDYGLAWDEGFTIEREERLKEWFGRVVYDPVLVPKVYAPRLSKLEPRPVERDGSLEPFDAESPWTRRSLRYYWQFAREEPNGHPPFYALLGLLGWAVSHPFIDPPGSYRFGPAGLVAFTVGVVYLFMAARYGRLSALLAVVGLVAMPRMFAHAHLASYDAPILCLWFLAVVTFLNAVESGWPTSDPPSWIPWLWILAFGLVWGCAAATKLTGWFIPVPLAAWACFYRDRRGAVVLLLGALVAAVVLYALIPTWWGEPIQGVRDFLRSNLTRASLNPIPTEFFGRIYDFSLPWYNTIVITAIVTPPITLGLALLGIGKVCAGRFQDRGGTLILGCWLFFMVLRALPNAPGHDGERQFLAAFVFLACLAGIGLTAVGTLLTRWLPPRLAMTGKALLLLATLSASAWSTWVYHPLQLSYYNVLIGGLSGATRAGMEPTYYWEAVTPDVREWLNTHTESGRSVSYVFPAVGFEYLHHWKILKPPINFGWGKVPAWFVVMNRPGHLKRFPWTLGQYLLEHHKPAFVKSLEVAPDVPLIAIFRGDELRVAQEAYTKKTNAAAAPPPSETRQGAGEEKREPAVDENERGARP